MKVERTKKQELEGLEKKVKEIIIIKLKDN